MSDWQNRYLANGQNATDPTQLLDRGLQYGDGVFRTLAVYQGHAQDLDGQLRHLQEDAARLGISIPMQTLRQECEAFAAQAGSANAVLKILLTRGSSQRGYSPIEDLNPNRYLYLSPPPVGLKDLAQEGITLRINPYRLTHNARLAGIKHLNRLEQILAKQAIQHSRQQDSLMLDIQEKIIGASQANIFFIREKVLHTPKLKHCGIAGRTRARILPLAAKAGLATEEGDYSLQSLHTVNEVFICNSVAGILPVTVIEDLAFGIGQATRQLQALLDLPALS